MTGILNSASTVAVDISVDQEFFLLYRMPTHVCLILMKTPHCLLFMMAMEVKYILKSVV